MYEEDGETIKSQESVTISFWDLHRGIKELSPRKREALWWNVILDQKQKDVAEIMNITTVSVGQYVEQAVLQLSEKYFAEEISKEEETKKEQEQNGLLESPRRGNLDRD